MNTRFILYFCLTACTLTFVNGLTCYECTLCSEPFNTANVTTVTANSTESCFKAKTLGFVNRGAMSPCVEANIEDNGLWCCNTDLCNDAQGTIAINKKTIILPLLFSILLINIIKPSD